MDTRVLLSICMSQCVSVSVCTLHTHILHMYYTAQENTQSVSTSAVQFGSQEGGQKVAKVTMSFTATSEKELSIFRGEYVQVLNDTRNWWFVMNKRGNCGFVPSNMLESLPTKPARDASKQGKRFPLDALIHWNTCR